MVAKLPEEEHPKQAFGWAARDESGVLSPFDFSRRAIGEKDVCFKVLYCGMCHSDLHMVKNEWGTSTYPLVPGVQPLKYYGLDKPGMHVGIVGLGGLGHMAVKFAKVMGVKAAMGTMDGIIDTVSAMHPLAPLIRLLKTNGKLVLVGAPEKPLELAAFPLIMGRKMVGGSGTGGMKETQEMINFAAKHNITADVEVIPIEYVNIAMERMLKADVRYRFVIDIGNTIKSTY
ncbi:hypothetical protein GH714_014847 [Hevea brasiliensis]|uniref:Alcohol dehydrogenase-like C-terminal domain-containing protein n=1 Tax=Hevea brasiliensis TaxID=3981 RepID=A0A6A6KQ29_HEVBR|nr:hypothetical protein GH714_014847 [Hevea brasiliensis]